MDKQKEIEKMEFIISTTVHDCEQKDCIRNCQFARQKDCKYFRAAKDLQAEGYGDVRYVAKDVLNKVFRYVEEARLECEFQDKDGKWFMDESEFMCEFTLGKLQELYREYGIEMFTGSEQTNNKKEVCGDGD